MYYYRSTQVPNEIFDFHLPYLNQAQLKVLLVVIRQTLGWIDPKTKKRKRKDWISSTFFQRKTGLTAKSISLGISELIRMDLILSFDHRGNRLKKPQDRRGKKRIYYAYAPYYRLTERKTMVDMLTNIFTFRPNTKQTLTKENTDGQRSEKTAYRRLSDDERYKQILRDKGRR